MVGEKEEAVLRFVMVEPKLTLARAVYFGN